MFALASVSDLDPTLLEQGLEAVIDAAQTDTQFPRQESLAEIRALLQTAQDFELDYFLETSTSLGGGYEAQGKTESGLRTLPPCPSRLANAMARQHKGGGGE